MSEPLAAVKPATGPAPAGPRGGTSVEGRGLHKSYLQADGSELKVLQGVDIRVEGGEAVAVVGASGAGKSTLLHLLGALDRPTAGDVLIGGEPVTHLDDRTLAPIRNRCVGFVFQFHHLLREFSALENVMMPGLIGGWSRESVEVSARDALDAVGLSHRLYHRPWQLSGGEQQRVAVARALVNDPLALLADEPTGNLDRHTSERVQDLLFALRAERHLALVLVTHNRELAERTDRILLLRDGRLHPIGGE
ncbi:MAG: ABC transporter ATP-binding protein [Gemmatimonadetes bacterium]|nr:ABC transporter ATP-binding protein [Gemmatimonadota bacterium]